ncbi:YciI family protein [Paraburkholderia sp. DHOC27]|uniref:YciI family protein n=1 Tax=Paraburkholderia sp. DHOC27 TaxID=2303330 RepID=UPI0015F2F091|nr:YciI family protein [Paraburkholderia sp. DHOC27]
MSELQAEIQRLVEPNLRKRLYVAFSYPVASVEETMPHIPEHIHYLLEHEDKVFLSGPFVSEGHIVGEGMTVLYAATEQEAAAFMDNEPFIRRGLRRYELKLWELREGTLSIRTRLSATRFELD